MKSPDIEEIEAKLEEGYIKHCEVEVAKLIANKLTLQEELKELRNRIAGVEVDIDVFKIDDIQRRSRYFGTNYAERGDCKAVQDFNK